MELRLAGGTEGFPHICRTGSPTGRRSVPLRRIGGYVTDGIREIPLDGTESRAATGTQDN